MKISKLKINNFKTYEDVEFNFIEDINIFTGVNNCGKTTVLEALALWNECFSKLIKQAKCRDLSLGLKLGDFRLGNKKQNYFEFSDIVSVRSPRYNDIFYNLDITNNIKISLEFKKGNENLLLGFILSKATGWNYNIYLDDSNFSGYEKFNDFFINFPNPINIIYASPVSKIQHYEEFERKIVIVNEIKQRNSAKVIRNRIYNIKDDKLNVFLEELAYILNNNANAIQLFKKGEYLNDLEISYDIKLTPTDTRKDISLLGSGTLQIIEILLSFYEETLDLNIILLDEPDSHIHRDIQIRLISLLQRNTNNSQIFITTHNESLIRSSNPNYIFHLESNIAKSYFPIGAKLDKLANIGLQPTKKMKILKELGSEDALDFVNALESDKLIFVEGKYDPLYIQTILDKKYINNNFNVMYWVFEGVNNIFKNIEAYKTIFSNIKNETTLWDKSSLVFDGDYLTNKQAENLEKDLKNKLKISVHIWKYYTVESVLLTDISKFSKLLYKIIGNEDLEIENITTDIFLEISNKIKEKLLIIDDSEYKGNITRWQKDKKSLFNNIGVSSHCLGDYHDFYTYIKEELEKNNFQVIATKNDIDDICISIYKKYEFDNYNDKDIFYELLQNIDSSTWFDSWDDMIMELKL
jgi:predicted ATP-dependent endonuclease of OLD family